MFVLCNQKYLLMTDSVKQIMTREVHTIDVSKTLFDAREMFKTQPIRHLPVVSGEKLVGMLSRTDIMRMSFGDLYGTDESSVDETLFDMLSIKDVMTRHPKAISPADPIDTVAEILIKEEFHALPVAEGNELVGIVTTTDIIKYQLDKLRVKERS